MDEGFLGFDTQHQRAFQQNNLWIGVGEPSSNRHLVAHSLTSSLDNGDFNSGAANSLGLNFNTNEPIIAVVKKNAHVLNRLEQWLSAQATDTVDGRRIIRDKSLLLIDDEADHASINTRKDELNPTTINRQIRGLLRLFQKSAYVGYTATPFANIFIPLNDDNLFPRDFIINIPTPSNYIGPDKIFGFEPLEEDEEPVNTLPVVIRIDDYQTFVPDRHKRDDQLPTRIPDSLRTAIKCFIVTCAIRRARGQSDEHNSMLIHVSRFQIWQARIKELVENVFNFYRMGIEQNNSGILNELRQTFEEDSDGYRSYLTTSQQILSSELSDIDPGIKIHTWDEILPLLHPAAAKIQVKEIHGGARDVLDYQAYDKKYAKEGEEAGLSVIAIGGNKLSRGLTLEGLSVSYYLRASKMYDTLMQMGRWFGFRSGYVDLCRLFTSRELNEWYCHIALASMELRNEFNYMSEIAGSTPEQYALRVRTHPGVLQISATNKIRSAVNVNVSWSGSLVETYKLSKSQEIIKSNYSSASKLVHNLINYEFEQQRSCYLWKNISPDVVVDFLNNFRGADNPVSDSSFLVRFIEDKIRLGELTKWRIAIMNKEKATKNETIEELTVGLFIRTQDDKNSNDSVYYLRKSHIISPKHEFVDLSREEYDEAMKRTAKLRVEKGKSGSPQYPNGNIVRNEIRRPDNPLLIIYMLDAQGAGLNEEENPIVGFAISFPGSQINSNVTYAVHKDLLPMFEVDDDFEDYEDED